jgi:hypothetical protein
MRLVKRNRFTKKHFQPLQERYENTQREAGFLDGIRRHPILCGQATHNLRANHDANASGQFPNHKPRDSAISIFEHGFIFCFLRWFSTKNVSCSSQR